MRKQKQQININEKGEITMRRQKLTVDEKGNIKEVEMRAKNSVVQIRVTEELKEQIVKNANSCAEGNITRYIEELVKQDTKVKREKEIKEEEEERIRLENERFNLEMDILLKQVLKDKRQQENK